MSTIELDWVDPPTLLAAYAPLTHIAFLESGGATTARARWSFLGVQPRRVLESSDADCWDQLASLRQKPISATSETIPFSGGVIGIASWEAGLALENIESNLASRVPHVTAFAFNGVFAFDRKMKRLYWTSDQGLPAPSPPKPIPRTTHVVTTSVPLTPDLSAEDWKRAVADIRNRIANGDVFQANMTSRWSGMALRPVEVHALYQRLRATSPAPFGGLFKSPEFSLLSASVERFISLDRRGQLETRPIKGTAPIGQTEIENAALKAQLKQDSKEFGENLMITDLMRNDISRVCKIGSVRVPELCAVETFAHVNHLVSTVRGKLSPENAAIDLLKASLPPGSVSGAPKHAALKIIASLEGSARNTYCGTLFWLGNDGAMDSNVIIRSILVKGNTIEVGAGGGITHPSDPEREYAEMCLKAEPLLRLFRP